MEDLSTLIKAWDDAIWEYSLVFEGLKDEDVWKRPHPKLLSIGELTGHVAYWIVQRTSTFSENPIESVLINPGFKYYPSNVDNPIQLDMNTEAVISELKRIHEAVKTAIVKSNPNTADQMPGSDATWGYNLEYMGFHAAYHAGQAYSVRHLMGQETTDN